MRIFSICLFATILSTVLPLTGKGSPGYPDIRESAVIGSDGGDLMAEDPESGLTVGLYIPADALREKTTITLVLHGTKQPGVLSKTNINGISILPKDLLLLEKARLEVYNPPVDVTNTTILYHVINAQFIIPLGSQTQHIDEGYIEGTFYATGNISLGIPDLSEVSAQSKKLSAYNPAGLLADTYSGINNQVHLIAVKKNDIYGSPAFGGPYIEAPFNNMPESICTSVAGDDCLRWQNVLTQVEGHVTWMNLRRLSGADQSASAALEQANAERALKNAIESYLSKQSGANRCGGYLRAAEKYLETARSLGMNTEALSFINQRYNQLINECSFEFAVETHEWINHPKETQGDGATFEEISNWYGTVRCIVPPTEFRGVQPRIMASEGIMSLHYEKHWIGDEKDDHTEMNGTWKARKIEGSVRYKITDSGSKYPEEVSMIIYWDKDVITRLWGKPGKEDKPYDWISTDTDPTEESKSYLLKNGSDDKIGNSEAGRSVRVFILRNPFDMKDDPNECF